MPQGILLNCVMARQEWPIGMELLSSFIKGFPNAKSYSSLMSGCDWRWAIKLLSGCGNALTYSSAMSACDKAGQWQWAIELLEEMLLKELKANDRSYSCSVYMATLWAFSI